MKITDEQRAQLAELIRRERQARFGTKSAAYREAGVNAQTWDNAEAGLPLREDRLIAILKVLWPTLGGQWEKILAIEENEARYAPRSIRAEYRHSLPDPISDADQWLQELDDNMSEVYARLERIERTIYGAADPTEEDFEKLDGLPEEGEPIAASDEDLAEEEEAQQQEP